MFANPVRGRLRFTAARSLALAIFLGVAAGIPNSAARGEAGRPEIDPRDPHRFVMQGAPWYPTGYYPSIGALLGESGDREALYRAMIDKQHEHGITLFRSVFNMGQPNGNNSLPYLRTGPGNAADGRPCVDLTKFDTAHFDYWRKVIEYARAKDIVVQLCIFDSWHNKRPVVSSRSNSIQVEWGMKYDFYAGGNNVNGIDTPTRVQWHDVNHPVFEHQRAMIRQVIDSVGDLPNIIFEISNENYTSLEWELRLADYLSDYERQKGLPRHLVMPRDLPNHDSAGGKQNDPRKTHDEMVANHAMNQPLIADNDGGGDVDPEGRRRKAWAALTAGGHIDYFHISMRRPGVIDSEDVAEGMRYIGNVGRFLTHFQMDLAGMRPSDGAVSNGWCYAEPGMRYIIYLPDGGRTTVTGLPGAYEAYWFDPRTAAVSAAGRGPDFQSPDAHDWVLFVRAVP